jgi:putative endonuclease
LSTKASFVLQMELFFLNNSFMYFIYILHSISIDKFYVGTTDNVELRLEQHNSGFYSDSFTTKAIPWVVRLKFEYESSKKAYELERFIKRMKSRKFIEKSNKFSFNFRRYNI